MTDVATSAGPREAKLAAFIERLVAELRPLELGHNQAFWLANTDDAWFRANGVATVRPITPSADNYAGSEVDLTVQWKVNAHLQVEAGYSHFFAGDYLSDTGRSDDADFGYVQAKLTF